MKQIICTTLICIFVAGFVYLGPSPSFGEIEKDNFEAEQVYRRYVEAWKLKDIAALEGVISGDYMAVDFRGKVSNKENEIATAKADAEWTSMKVEEIHTRIFGKTATVSGFISAQGKTTDGNIFDAKVRFLGVLVKHEISWQLVATQSTSFKPVPIARASSEMISEATLGERLVREYEKQAGLGSTPELDGISRYIISVGSQVASVLPSGGQYHFVFDPNPDFKSAFALPSGYIIVGGGLLAIAQTEDELANVLAHEIEHVELGQVSRRVSDLGKQKEIKNLELSEFLPGYTKEEELACDLNGQKLAAKAGYSPAGMLTLLETFKALRKGDPEELSGKHPSLSERIAQAEPFANASPQKQKPLRIP